VLVAARSTQHAAAVLDKMLSSRRAAIVMDSVNYFCHWICSFLSFGHASTSCQRDKATGQMKVGGVRTFGGMWGVPNSERLV